MSTWKYSQLFAIGRVLTSGSFRRSKMQLSLATSFIENSFGIAQRIPKDSSMKEFIPLITSVEKSEVGSTAKPAGEVLVLKVNEGKKYVVSHTTTNLE